MRAPGARGLYGALVLALMAANYGIRAAAHHQALVEAPRIFGPLIPRACDEATPEPQQLDRWPRPQATASANEPARRCLVQIVALPTFASPFRWRVVAELSDAYEIHDINLLDPWFRTASSSVGMWRTSVRVPNVWTPAVWTASQTEVGQRFLGFARLPAARSLVAPDGITTVQWVDLRFARGARGLAEMAGPRDQFVATVRLGPDSQPVEERIGP
jgi:hypothetical protein